MTSPSEAGPLTAAQVEALLAGIAGQRIAVVGDLMLDRYLVGEATRLSPEAPVPVVSITERREALGGAANVAANVVAFGGTARLVGVLGDDVAGSALRARLLATGLSDDGVLTMPARPTTVKTRIIARGQQLIRVDEESDAPLEGAALNALIRRAESAVADSDALVLEDYDKGVLVPALIATAIAAASSRKIPIIVDPKYRNFFAFAGATVFKPNRPELARALGATVDAARLEALPGLRQRLNVTHLLVTLGAEGMLLVGGEGAMTRIAAQSREVFDVSGAGDTVTSWLAGALSAGASLLDAARLANLAAGVEVGKQGVAVVTPEEVRAAVG
ncbi:MAG: PfkB family carbohydrate kinase [Gemmatimonadales bacterium]